MLPIIRCKFSSSQPESLQMCSYSLLSYSQHINMFVPHVFITLTFLLRVLIVFYGISEHLLSLIMPESVPAAPWDVELLVFISIQCFFCVFISEISSCVCQLQWKARDTTESGSRLNRFHAISATLRGICLPLGEEKFSHSGGFLSSWYSQILPALRMKPHIVLFLFFLSIPDFPPVILYSQPKKHSKYGGRKSALDKQHEVGMSRSSARFEG